MAKETTPPPSEAELRARLEELKMEYDLARMGMLKSGYATLYMSIIALVGLVLTFVARFYRDRELFSGTHVVMLVLIVAGALIMFSSFVFGRAARIKVENQQDEKAIRNGCRRQSQIAAVQRSLAN